MALVTSDKEQLRELDFPFSEDRIALPRIANSCTRPQLQFQLRGIEFPHHNLNHDGGYEKRMSDYESDLAKTYAQHKSKNEGLELYQKETTITYTTQ